MTNKPMLSVERDERADFEKEVQAKAERFQPDFRRYGLHPDAEYKCANNQWAWELWQKRASMDKPAAQHQGEPVAELQVAFFEHGPMATINWFTPSAFESGATKLYAEQPAPVAVVITDDQILEAMRQSLTDADGGYVFDTAKDDVIAAGRALLEVARLNGVKP